MADVGATTTAEVVGQLEQEAERGGLEGGEALTRPARRAARRHRAAGRGDRIDLRHEPTVIMVAGVNGTGKTTTIGKLAWHLQHELGQTVVLGAADTFRAAAVEQLERLGRARGRARSSAATGGLGPGRRRLRGGRASGRERGADVVIIDTAGRLHTQDDLMAELAQDPPRHRQAAARRAARDAAHRRRHDGPERPAPGPAVLRGGPVDGIVLTKLDGTAKGGIALAIAGELGIPVKLIGIGEPLEDLRPFDADDFARALLCASRPTMEGHGCVGLLGDRWPSSWRWARSSRSASSWPRSRSARRGGAPRRSPASALVASSRRSSPLACCCLAIVRPIARRHVNMPPQLRTGTAALVG